MERLFVHGAVWAFSLGCWALLGHLATALRQAQAAKPLLAWLP